MSCRTHTSCCGEANVFSRSRIWNILLKENSEFQEQKKTTEHSLSVREGTNCPFRLVRKHFVGIFRFVRGRGVRNYLEGGQSPKSKSILRTLTSQTLGIKPTPVTPLRTGRFFPSVANHAYEEKALLLN